MATLVERMRAQRQSWLTLDQERGLEVLVQRPPEARMAEMLKGISAEHAVTYVVGWKGFSEATLLGAAIGSSDAIAFDAAAWAEAVGDRVEWSTAVANKLAELITSHLEQRAQSSKN